MIVLDTIREFNTANFRVVVEAVEDTDVDLSFDHTGEILRRLQDGSAVAFGVRVRVLHSRLGEIGFDYLGGCIYDSYGAFEDHRECGAQNREYELAGENARCGSYFHDMIKGAIHDARLNLSEAASIHVRATA